jgi:hypothetical protein
LAHSAGEAAPHARVEEFGLAERPSLRFVDGEEMAEPVVADLALDVGLRPLELFIGAREVRGIKVRAVEVEERDNADKLRVLWAIEIEEGFLPDLAPQFSPAGEADGVDAAPCRRQPRVEVAFEE